MSGHLKNSHTPENVPKTMWNETLHVLFYNNWGPKTLNWKCRHVIQCTTIVFLFIKLIVSLQMVFLGIIQEWRFSQCIYLLFEIIVFLELLDRLNFISYGWIRNFMRCACAFCSTATAHNLIGWMQHCNAQIFAFIFSLKTQCW